MAENPTSDSFDFHDDEIQDDNTPVDDGIRFFRNLGATGKAIDQLLLYGTGISQISFSINPYL